MTTILNNCVGKSSFNIKRGGWVGEVSRCWGGGRMGGGAESFHVVCRGGAVENDSVTRAVGWANLFIS